MELSYPLLSWVVVLCLLELIRTLMGFLTTVSFVVVEASSNVDSIQWHREVTISSPRAMVADSRQVRILFVAPSTTIGEVDRLGVHVDLENGTAAGEGTRWTMAMRVKAMGRGRGREVLRYPKRFAYLVARMYGCSYLYDR
jgi:hypothetical protein